jgi:hypothetical protein
MYVYYEILSSICVMCTPNDWRRVSCCTCKSVLHRLRQWKATSHAEKLWHSPEHEQAVCSTHFHTLICVSLVRRLSDYYVIRNEFWSENVKGRDNLQDLGADCSFPWHLFHEAYKCHTHADLKPRYSALASIASV